MPDAFISYSRKNIAFARLLMEAFEKNDIQAWIDWQDIPPSADWLAEVYEAIEASDTFIFIISENSVVSEICELEIAHAVENNKRLIPIVVNEVHVSDVPASMAALNWIFFTNDAQFGDAFKDLLAAIQVDRDWLKEHTRLQNRALAWIRRDRHAASLMRGHELAQAEEWLSQGKGMDPVPTTLQTEFIFASRNETSHRQRLGTIIGAAGILATLVLGFWAWSQRVEAVETTHARATAESMAIEEADARATAQTLLEDQYLSASSKNLAAQSGVNLGDQLDLGLLLALEAIDMEENFQTRGALFTALTDQLHLQKFLYRDPLFTVQAMAFDPEGNVVITSRTAQRMLVFDPRSGTILHDVPTPHEIVNLVYNNIGAAQPGIRYSSDGEWMLTAGEDKSWMLWDTATYQPIGDPLTDNPAWQTAIGISPDFDLLATYDEDVLTVWDRTSGAQILQLADLPGPIRGGPIFTYDAAFLIVPFEDQLVHVIRVESGEIIQTFELDPDFGTKLTLVVNEQGTQLGILGSKMTYLFDLQSGEEIIRYDHQYGSGYQLFFDSGGQAYMLYDYKETDLYIERLGEKTVVYKRFPHFDESSNIDFFYAINPANFQVVTRRSSMVGVELILYDPILPHTILEQVGFGEGTEVTSISEPAFHPTLDTVLAAGTCGSRLQMEPCWASVWDLASASPENLFSIEVSRPIHALAFHPLGDILAVAAGDGTISLVEWRQEEQVTPLEGFTDTVAALEFSADGNYLAAYSNAEGVPALIWELESGDTHEYPCPGSGEQAEITDIAYHPGRSTLAVACGDRVVLWDIETKAVEAEITLDEDLAVFEKIAFHPEGSQLVSGGDDGFIRWDLQSLQPLSMPSEDTTSSWGLRILDYDPKGSMLLTGSVTNLRLFDAESGDFIGQLDPLGINTLAVQDRYYLPWALSVSASGSRVATYALDNTLLFWNLDIEFWKQAACSIANRNLTAAEWKTYLGDIAYQETCP